MSVDPEVIRRILVEKGLADPLPAPTPAPAPAPAPAPEPAPWEGAGNMYTQVPGTDYWQTKTSVGNSNAQIYDTNGRAVPWAGYSNQQTGQSWNGYITPQQQTELMNNVKINNPGGASNLFESWLNSGALPNQSGYQAQMPTMQMPQTSLGGVSTDTPSWATTSQPADSRGGMYGPTIPGYSSSTGYSSGGGGGGGSAPSVTSTVTSVPSGLRWNEGADYMVRLNHFKSSPQDARKEILALKLLAAQNANNPSRLQEIGNWANQVRQAAGISNDDLDYGNNSSLTPEQQLARTQQLIANLNGGGNSGGLPPGYGGGWNPNTGQYNNGGGTQTQTPAAGGGMTPEQIKAMMEQMVNPWMSGQQDWQKNTQQMFQQMMQAMQQGSQSSKAYTDQLFAQFQQLMQQTTDQNNARWNEEKRIADEQAKKIADERKAQFQSVIDQLQSGQKTELDMLNNYMLDAKASQEDKTFQNWLATRQGVVNSGMQNSGIAEDANTRLMLASNRNMANLYNQNQTKLSEISSRYGNKLSDAQRQLAGVNESELAKEQFNKLYQEGSKGLSEQAKVFADLFKSTLPYSQAKPGDIMGGFTDLFNTGMEDYWKYQQDQWNRDKQASDDQFRRVELAEKSRQFYDQLGFDYDKLDTQTKLEYDKMYEQSDQFYAKLEQDNYWKDKDNQLDYLKTMLPYTQLTKDQEAKYTYYYDKMANDSALRQMDAQSRVQVASINAAAKAQAAHQAQQYKLQLESAKADLKEREALRKRLPSDAEVDMFLANLDTSDTRESVAKTLQEQYQAGNISAEKYQVFMKAGEATFQQNAQLQAEAAAARQQQIQGLMNKAVPAEQLDSALKKILAPGVNLMNKFSSWVKG